MNEPTFKPEKITKPIQVLGAWLAGLFSIDSCFLFAAARMPANSWESGALTIAAIINVPLFLLAVFLLQTRFRPELQEDSYYSTYLSRKTNEPINVSKEDVQFAQLRQRLLELEDKVSSPIPAPNLQAVTSAISGLKIGVNEYLGDKALIGNKLSELGVSGYSLFGGEEAPEGRVVAISERLSKDVVTIIIRVAKELGFVGYSFIDNFSEHIEEDILFGSYGSATYQISGAQTMAA